MLFIEILKALGVFVLGFIICLIMSMIFSSSNEQSEFVGLLSSILYLSAIVFFTRQKNKTDKKAPF